jgi:putative polyhydroxyalkanoate system protein
MGTCASLFKGQPARARIDDVALSLQALFATAIQLAQNAPEGPMASIDIRHPHGTDTEDASARTRALLADFQTKRSDLIKDVTWVSDTKATLKGTGFEGSFEVTGDAVVVKIDLGFLARAFKGQVQEILTKKLSREFTG